MYASGQYTVAAIATTLGVGRASIYRHLPRAGGWLSRPLASGRNASDVE
jgi:transposase-like protein